ncbi:MAG: hypothetical protein H6811_11095, partial [Phycisphaeraceae bacterium]|nr:hypothetical protein [Phycisphaeraceae bacterium]
MTATADETLATNIRVSRLELGGTETSLGKFDIAYEDALEPEFLRAQWGGGTFIIREYVQGKRGHTRQSRPIIIEGPPAGAAPAPAAPPPPPPSAPAGFHGYPPPPFGQFPQYPAPSDRTMDLMLAMMQNNQSLLTTTMQTVLQSVLQRERTPMADMLEAMRSLDKLRGRGARATDEDDIDDQRGFLTELLRTFNGANNKAAPGLPPPSAPTPPRPTPTPARPNVPPSDDDTPEAPSEDDRRENFAAMVRILRRGVARMTDDAEDTDSISTTYAEVLFDLIPEDDHAGIAETDPGTL